MNEQKNEIIPIPKGSLLVISIEDPPKDYQNEYRYQGIFRVLKDIDTCSLLEDWLVLHPKQTDDRTFNSYKFIEWIIDNGYIEEWIIEKRYLKSVDYLEWRFIDSTSQKIEYFVNRRYAGLLRNESSS